MLFRTLETENEQHVCDDCKEKHNLEEEVDVRFTILAKEHFLPFTPIPGMEISLEDNDLFINNVKWIVEYNSFEILLLEKSYSEELYEMQVQKALDNGWDLVDESVDKEEKMNMLN